MGQSSIWREHGLELSKSDEVHQSIDSKSDTNLKQKKHQRSLHLYIVKLLKTKNKEKTLKEAREKRKITFFRRQERNNKTKNVKILKM